jgi:ABC-2 type transport system permease protein
MSAVVARWGVAPRPAPVHRGYCFELVKLAAQWRVRLLLVACWLGPAVFVVAVSQQSALPADTLFGRWMGQTGWAGSLVVLSFCCSWVLPLVTSLVAGDVFATEDRVGTWRHLLVVVRSQRRVFATKVLAGLTITVALTAGLAASSVVGGLVAVGNRPLVGLDGHLLAPGQAAGAVLLAWAGALAPTLAFAAVGLLGSVALGRSPMGLLLPAVLALLLQLLQVLPLPVAVRVALPSYAFVAWRGLFSDPAQTIPLVVGVLVGLAWATAATALAYLLFVRRDFTDPAYEGSGRRVLAGAVVPLAALLAVTAGVVSVATPATASGIDRAGLQASLATAYGHLYRLQAQELHRPEVTERSLRAAAVCDKGGARVEDVGPGSDWRCVVSWHLPGATAVGSAVYQLDVTADGRYVADGDGPREVNGFFQVCTPTGDAPNPLWQFDSSVDLLSATSKG